MLIAANHEEQIWWVATAEQPFPIVTKVLREICINMKGGNSESGPSSA